MKVARIQTQVFLSEENNKYSKEFEFIDKLSRAVKNPRDVEDCVAVPRGIFKAYFYIMSGSALLAVSNLLPKKMNVTKTVLSISGWALNTLSALYFAKPFFVKGLSPTVKREDIEKNPKI